MSRLKYINMHDIIYLCINKQSSPENSIRAYAIRSKDPAENRILPKEETGFKRENQEIFLPKSEF